MQIYYCRLTLHDNVFFATREMGILYETEKYLHNWALTYAFFASEYMAQPYRLQGELAQKPSYLDPNREQNLLALNPEGIYLFPARPLRYSYQVNTFKAAQTHYYGKSKQFGEKGANRNYPINYGRAKELAVGSEYCTYLIAADLMRVPRWVRVGKWMAKVKVSAQLIPEAAIASGSGDYTCLHPLNPIDLPPTQELLVYNRIVMPPVSLISQARLQGEYLQLRGEEWDEWRRDFPEIPSTVYLPKGVSYGARSSANVR